MQKSQEYQECFESNGIFYVIEKNKFESRETFLERVWFIIDNLQNPKNIHSFEKLEIISKIESNKKIFGCQY